MENMILKPFNLQDALAGKAVRLRDGRKAYVRQHETEVRADGDRLFGSLQDGSWMSWCESGEYYGTDYGTGRISDYDIIGMYQETRIINGFEVPMPETEEPKYGTRYYLASLDKKLLYSYVIWDGRGRAKLWLERGLVFLSREDAIANAKAMLGIDPFGEEELCQD